MSALSRSVEVVWQGNCFEHISSSDADPHCLRDGIATDPTRWKGDESH